MSIRKVIKNEVWNRYIGQAIGISMCLLCEKNPISQQHFACSHVVAKSKGGDLSIENLRPLCTQCNLLMGTDHMTEYAKTYYPCSPLISTLPPAPVRQSKSKLNIKTPKTTVTRPKEPKQRHNLQCETKDNGLKQSSVIDVEKIGERFKCQYCLLEFSLKFSVDRHIANGSCKVLNPVQSKKELLRHNKDQALLIQSITANFNDVANRLVKDVEKTVTKAIKQKTTDDAKRVVIKEGIPQTIQLAHTINNYNVISN